MISSFLVEVCFLFQIVKIQTKRANSKFSLLKYFQSCTFCQNVTKLSCLGVYLSDPSYHLLSPARHVYLQEESYRRLMSSTKLLTDTNSVAKVMFEKSQLERQLGLVDQ